MGLSASQARLLSVTQRISNNELKSEILAKNKIELAARNTAASEKYIDALNATTLKYNVYEKSGIKETVALTFNALSSYSDLKTQYALMNTSGQIYVEPEIAKKFENSNNLYEFLNSLELATKNDDGYEISDSKMAQWYTNLWYKMDGRDEVDIKISQFTLGLDSEFITNLETIEKIGKAGNYLEMNADWAASTTWLQFALENGLATLARIQNKNDDENTNYWRMIEYSNATDIVEVDDDVAVAKAEAEYNKTLRQIQAEDKELDNDLKKLDTEHSSLKAEYESIKKVLSKNVERSFTAFS